MRNTSVIVVALAVIQAAPGQERKIVVLTAAELAKPEQRSEQPTAGKWWLRPVEGVPGKAFLVTGKVNEGPIGKEHLHLWGVVPSEFYTPAMVPALEIDPKLKGWYRIQLGMPHLKRHEHVFSIPFHPRLWGRLSGEPYPEYLQTPQEAEEPVALVDWRSADLTGKKLLLEQPPAAAMHPGRGWFGGVSHIVFTPLDDKEIAAAREEQRLAPVKDRLFGMLDLTDEIWWYGAATTPEDIKGVIYRHEKAGFGRVYMRVFGTHLDHSHAVPEANPRWTEADEAAFRKANKSEGGWQVFLDMPKHFDPLKVAVDYGNELGIEVHAWIRMTNFNRAPYAEFWHKNPQLRAQLVSRDPKTGATKMVPYSRVMSFAYPEVRSFYVKLCKQMASTGTRGILLDLLRHPPLAGFEAPTVAAYKEKYGEDLLARANDKTSSQTLLLRDPKVVSVLEDFLEKFLVELRKEVGPEFEIGVRSSGPSAYGLRGKEWIDKGLIQTIVDGNWYSGNGPRKTIDATVKAAASKGHPYAVAEPGNVNPKNNSGLKGTLSAEAILYLAEHYHKKGVERFGLYESTEFCWRPELRRAIRAAGRIFEK